jgi:hypothetical protein
MIKSALAQKRREYTHERTQSLRMSERKLRRWRLLHRTPDRVGEAAVGVLTIGAVVVVVALAPLVGWAILRFAGVLH